MSATAHLFAIQNPIRNYDWGSTHLIADHLGRTPSGEPEAEMWLGAHPGDPSIESHTGTRLDAMVEANPALLGEPSSDSTQFPFLMKLLAAERPLSLQVHPSKDQARAGYEREEAAGLTIDNPQRSYKDREHKPEIIVALTPFSALCGFRSPRESARDLASILRRGNGHELADQLLNLLGDDDEDRAIRSAFEFILSGHPQVADVVAEVRRSAEGSALAAAATVRLLGEKYGDDPGVLAAVLLNRIELQPGEAVFMGAGNVHAYLSGLGIEAMAPSDNVLRGGLTTKHVDVPGLLEIVNFTAITPTLITPETQTEDGMTVTSYLAPVPEFSVHIIELESGTHTLEGITGPSVLIVAEGSLDLPSAAGPLHLKRGERAFQAAGGPLEVHAVGEKARIYLTTVGGVRP
jgi:mannose-6-phosphate isomerase